MVSGPPLSPPKPLENKSPKTGTHWKTAFTQPRTHTSIYGNDTRKETMERPRTLSADPVSGPGHPPQIHACAKTAEK